MRAYAESPYAEVVAVCDVSLERARQVADQFGVAHAFNDYRQLLALPEVDAVDIATPNDVHCEITLAALAARKHVLCEKPLALSVDDARRMEVAAVEAGLQAKVNFIHRYVPAVRYVKQLLDEGALGHIYHCNITYAQGHLTDATAPRVWRMNKVVTGTGVLGDLGTHAIDLARHWLGTELTSVSGRLTTFTKERPLPGATGPTVPLVPVDVDDEATWLASFANSIRGSIQASLGKALWQRGAWATLPVPSGLMRDDGKTSLHHWIEDLVLGTEIAPTFRDGVRAQEVVDAVVRSAEARQWIDVELSQPVRAAVLA
jgi:predicted dehydrogenase